MRPMEPGARNSEFGRGNQSHGRRTPHKVGMFGVVAIPQRQQIAMPADHHGPPAAFARLSRQHEAAWHNFMPGAWQRFVCCGRVVRRLLNQHGRCQFRVGFAADMRQELAGAGVQATGWKPQLSTERGKPARPAPARSMRRRRINVPDLDFSFVLAQTSTHIRPDDTHRTIHEQAFQGPDLTAGGAA
jgi:hypothetical protein